MNFSYLKRDIRKRAIAGRARTNASFFKIGKGEYVKDDRFLGLTLGERREIAKWYCNLNNLHFVLRLLYFREMKNF